jgi:hypothetical protein
VRVTQKNQSEKICKQHFVDLTGFNLAAWLKTITSQHGPAGRDRVGLAGSMAAAAVRSDGIH